MNPQPQLDVQALQATLADVNGRLAFAEAELIMVRYKAAWLAGCCQKLRVLLHQQRGK